MLGALLCFRVHNNAFIISSRSGRDLSGSRSGRDLSGLIRHDHC